MNLDQLDIAAIGLHHGADAVRHLAREGVISNDHIGLRNINADHQLYRPPFGDERGDGGKTAVVVFGGDDSQRQIGIDLFQRPPALGPTLALEQT